MNETLFDAPLFDDRGEPLEELYELAELARASGLSQRALTRFVELGLIDPVETQPQRFPATVLVRVARIQRLRRHLRINLAGTGVVLELVERIETLERELDRRR